MTTKETIERIWTSKELRNSIIFVLLILVALRLLAHIPIPGVNADNLKAFFASNQVLGLLNVFSGGSMEQFSIIALGVGPYITASIIFQLLGMVFPKIEEMQKEGTAGRERINQYTRLATVPLALIQSYSIIALLRQSNRGIINSGVTFGQIALISLTMTAGTILLMWLGELISERKIGNGISIIIFAGIIARMPSKLEQALVSYDPSQIFVWLAYVVIGVLTIAGVVFMSEAQRNIPVIYAKHMRGNSSTGGVETNLPLRINMAGVIPIIFAISLILFPSLIAQFFLRAKTAWIAAGAERVITLFQNQLFYGILYFILVFAFTYFYTSIVFRADQAAENIQKQGGFIPGVRPGNPTAEFLTRVINRITPAGALFLAVIAVLPIAVQQLLTGNSSFVVGGTSLLIVVSVAIEIVSQVNAKLSMNDYENI